MPEQTHEPARQLILRLNAMTGLVSGPALALGAPAVAALLGLERYAAAVPLAQVTGVGLIVFALLLLWIARRPIASRMMLTIGVIDALWVVASVALLVSRVLPLSTAGAWIIGIQAEVIALLAGLELRSWWRTRRAAPELARAVEMLRAAPTL